MTTSKESFDEEQELKRCFVVGPIGEAGTETRIKADWVLDGIVKPVLEKRGYLVERADGISKPGNIDTQVINAVIEAELVVADLSEHNANAFYELGLRHMSPNKPVIHMIRKGEKIPFDNTAFRTITFDHSSVKGLEQAKADLEAQVVEIEKEGFKVETPVSRARAVNEVKFEGTDAEKVLQSQIDELNDKVESLLEVHLSEQLTHDKEVGSIRPVTFNDLVERKDKMDSRKQLKGFIEMLEKSKR